LQHGLIATKDIFYVFPEVTKSIIHKALFADRILVFGEYWKSVLEKGVEYSSEKIEKIGYYLYDDFNGFDEIKDSINKFADGKKIILITTQTSLHDYFATYIKWLANDINTNKLPYKIIVKNHPLEKPEHYKVLEGIANVKIMNCPLPLLFKQSSLHISIYSTTLFDGVRYGITGYALDVAQCSDYVNELVASGVAKKIGLNQNPTSLEAISSSLDGQYFYEQFENSVGIL